jgi:hypothetical protein
MLALRSSIVRAFHSTAYVRSVAGCGGGRGARRGAPASLPVLLCSRSRRRKRALCDCRGACVAVSLTVRACCDACSDVWSVPPSRCSSDRRRVRLGDIGRSRQDVVTAPRTATFTVRRVTCRQSRKLTAVALSLPPPPSLPPSFLSALPSLREQAPRSCSRSSCGRT